MKHRYILSCDGCSTEYHFWGRKVLRGFKAGSKNMCPECHGFLSPIPLCSFTLSPPPNMKKSERKIDYVDVK